MTKMLAKRANLEFYTRGRMVLNHTHNSRDALCSSLCVLFNKNVYCGLSQVIVLKTLWEVVMNTSHYGVGGA